jgi:hypothetical protein
LGKVILKSKRHEENQMTTAVNDKDREAAQAAAKARYTRALRRMDELALNPALEPDYLRAVAEAAEAEAALTAVMQEQIR